uniref:Uncharacterized protein n=1 Tax=Rhizophora mucronata TaxID=61149 RepID=A0A2P2QC92_RHIMU
MTYKFVPGSYSVISSKGTSDHHIVKVDVTKVGEAHQGSSVRRSRKANQKCIKITNSSPSAGVWKLNT